MCNTCDMVDYYTLVVLKVISILIFCHSILSILIFFFIQLKPADKELNSQNQKKLDEVKDEAKKLNSVILSVRLFLLLVL